MMLKLSVQGVSIAIDKTDDGGEIKGEYYWCVFIIFTDDVSSISGSESDMGSEDETNDSSTNALQSASRDKTAKVKHKRINRTGSSSESEDEKTIHGRENRDRRLQASRHVKVFFENADGKIFSLYRCLLHGKKEVQEKDEVLISLAKQTVGKGTWAIIMLGGGHFAAAIFHGSEVVVHKTFHSYTVRAGQGGGQSSRDSRSGGSHPKSAGASLRRYNEASLLQVHFLNQLIKSAHDL
uniref:VLRF1 domain-containing protein n=1 Tax=Timema tahoe TaxID=61484 RepID=A0A7R9NXB9_9NEOP|nr:unnamed protein product [Timema tahoe]